MADITILDCEVLYERFTAYTETAEQHEFVKLAIVHRMLDITREHNWGISQKEKRTMFRTVLTVIGEDCSMYKEGENGEALAK